MTCQSKYCKVILLGFFSILILVLPGYIIQDEKYIVKINVAENHSSDKLILSVCLFSRTVQKLRIPEQQSLVFGYSDDKFADCYFEVLEIKDSKGVAVSPTADYQFFNTKKKFTLLAKDKSVSYKFDLTNFYTLIKDKEYKIRLTFNLSKYGATDNISSDWLVVKM